ncbi:MAG: methylenetetrahydrofolate reductase [NAD(P)H] [Gammaproteobacteria bacterium]|uniref:Methylenetetrahydrofolate reductase n=1 Tax=OM182 bacterium MED-G24 TaxID=1986255 RepID=A0A2A5X106_9GAMM|nr:methylenetetrahydrofolate reductase [NAD(P)H] [Gammaproteobacteria bacterium]PDH42193.1 MAG: methylenetetrahydrofolate reductase [NAD(P)H] [OM182 bacterium MED-G24]RPG23198.1 MAG: methylenetetrahydrofolate reductase [NAD(P)H] [Gammaproteobacteria bacterium TMED50]
MNTPVISFEFSAPRDEQARNKVLTVRDKLSELDAAFFSITYGAGGSTRDGTLQTALALASTGTNTAPHLSFGGDDEVFIRDLLAQYQAAGIDRIVALRGDVPSGTGPGTHIYADELVTFIRQESGDHFHIEVAAYPEVHPDSKSPQSDLDYFKQKVDAGADSAITQYFYNADAYFHYVDSAAALGVDIPIVPGIMPITNVDTLIRFSDKCGADIPRWIKQQLIEYRGDKASLQSFATDLVTSLCHRLLEGGAPGLHFYTLNQSLPTLRIFRQLSL